MITAIMNEDMEGVFRTRPRDINLCSPEELGFPENTNLLRRTFSLIEDEGNPVGVLQETERKGPDGRIHSHQVIYMLPPSEEEAKEYESYDEYDSWNDDDWNSWDPN